jgi:FkbM family methyltransferase
MSRRALITKITIVTDWKRRLLYLFSVLRLLRYKLNSRAIEELVKRNNFALIIYNLDRLLYYRTVLYKGKFLIGLSSLPDGNRILHPLQDIHILDRIYLEKYYEKVRGIKEGDVVVDCGAHVGTFTIKAASVGARYVLSIEPDPIHFALLRLNVNYLDNVKIINVAIGEKDQPQKELIPYGRKVVVSIRSIRSLVSQYGIDQIDFLKIDVEGAEIEALKGLEGVKVNFIAMEYHGKERKNKAEEMLKKMGFEVISVDEGELGRIFACVSESFQKS